MAASARFEALILVLLFAAYCRATTKTARTRHRWAFVHEFVTKGTRVSRTVRSVARKIFSATIRLPASSQGRR